MEVILLEKIRRLGAMGDVVNVKNGFARNYLIPQNRALRATKENRDYFETQRADIEKRNDELRTEAQKFAGKLDGLQINLVRAASEDGRLYGSVTVRDLADELLVQGHEIERKYIMLPSTIKATGIYDFTLALHPEVAIALKVKVVRNESEINMPIFEEEKEAAVSEVAATDAAAEPADEAVSDGDTLAEEKSA